MMPRVLRQLLIYAATLISHCFSDVLLLIARLLRAMLALLIFDDAALLLYCCAIAMFC